MINSLFYETNLSKEKTGMRAGMLNIILNIIESHNKTFKIQMIIYSYIEQHKWMNFIMLNVLVILQNACKNENEKSNFFFPVCPLARE